MRVGTTVLNGIRLTFYLPQPYIAPLCLGMIIITKKTSGPALVGSVAPGDSTRFGRVYLDMNEEAFNNTQTQAVIPFKVIISYDSLTLEVFQMEIIRDLTLAAHSAPLALEGAVAGNGAPAHHG